MRAGGRKVRPLNSGGSKGPPGAPPPNGKPPGPPYLGTKLGVPMLGMSGNPGGGENGIFIEGVFGDGIPPGGGQSGGRPPGGGQSGGRPPVQSGPHQNRPKVSARLPAYT